LQNAKNKTAVKLTAVSCAPVVEVKIKRPDTKYQLGFSVQNGVVRNRSNLISKNAEYGELNFVFSLVGENRRQGTPLGVFF
jgi:hypothetical protein